jgi:hypothetical protein
LSNLGLFVLGRKSNQRFPNVAQTELNLCSHVS